MYDAALRRAGAFRVDTTLELFDAAETRARSMERAAYRFTQLRMASGTLSARGHITIAPSKALSGQLNASVKGAGPIASIPLTVAGTVDAPAVYPNATALIGAAAGAAVLGPGLGAAAGAKLGEIADGLFGKSTKPARSR